MDWKNIEAQVDPADKHEEVGECLEPSVGNVHCYLEYRDNCISDVMYEHYCSSERNEVSIVGEEN